MWPCLLCWVFISRSLTVGESFSDKFLCTARAKCAYKYDYSSECTYQSDWRYKCLRDSAFDPAITRWKDRARTSSLVSNYDLSPSSQADSSGYWVPHYYPLHSSTAFPRLSHPPPLITPPSRAQQPVCDVGVHGRCMHGEWSEGGEGGIGTAAVKGHLRRQ